MSRAQSAWSSRAGATAVEFAALMPVLAVLFAGTADIGAMLIKRIQLNTTLAAASNYALVNQAKVSAATGGALATSLGAIISGVGTSRFADSSVVVNNGPRQTTTGGVVGAVTGTASNADACYCPQLSGTTVAWGVATPCGNSCASGLRAGKFVELVASRAHTPIFASFGMVRAGTISIRTLVQTG